MRTQQTHQYASRIAHCRTLRLSKGAAMWRCCVRGTWKMNQSVNLSGGTDAPVVPWCRPQRSKFALRPSLSSPKNRRTPRSAVSFFGFENSNRSLVTAALPDKHLPDRGQNTGALIRDERGSQRFFLRSARGSASAELKNTPHSVACKRAHDGGATKKLPASKHGDRAGEQRFDSARGFSDIIDAWPVRTCKKFLSSRTRKWACCLIFRVPARYAG